MSRVYWSAPLFDNAWQAYNAACVGALRRAGIDVFLPQEHAFGSSDVVPSASAIFAADLAAIRDSDALVAALDGETIDAGVAAEAALAYAYGIPVLGLFTDRRRAQSGIAGIHKNLFVIGLVQQAGRIVHDETELVAALGGLLDAPRR